MSVNHSIVISAKELKEQVSNSELPSEWIEDILEIPDNTEIKVPDITRIPRPKAPKVMRTNKRAFTDSR